MTDRTCFAFPLATLVLLCASQAAADVAPPADYVEQCTVEKQATETTECVECVETKDPAATGRCTTLLSGYGYKSACDAWGAARYTHKEVWCRTRDANAPALPPSVSNQLCSSAAPIIDPNAAAAGAPSCTDSTPVVANGGSSSTAPTNGPENGSGCSVSRNTGTRDPIAGLIGLLGLTLIANRRRAR